MRIGHTASIALVVLSSAMAVAVFPPWSYALLAPFAWIPLFLALHGKSAAVGFRLGILQAFLLSIGTLNWLWEIFGVGSLILMLVPAFFTGIATSVAATLSRSRLPSFPAAVLTAVAWTGCEFFRCEWFTLRFPWITPGTGFPPNALTPIIGVYGVSLLIALASSLVASRRNLGRTTGGVLALLILLLGVLRPPVIKPEKPIRVAAIQTESGDIDACLRLSSTIPGSVDVMVWPEYAVQGDIRTNPEALARTRSLMRDKGCKLLVLACPVQKDRGTTENTAISIGLDEIFGTHVKNRPVHFMADGTPGTEAPAIPTPLGFIGTTICFDNDYECIVRRAVTNGAQLLLIPSMDSMEWTERQHLQHAVFALHRAAENGRWLVVSSSSGKTQIVDPHGNTTPDVVPLMQEGVLVGEVATQSYRTLYTRFGWLLGPVCTVITAATIVTLLALAFRKWRTDRKLRAADGETQPPADPTFIYLSEDPP